MINFFWASSATIKSWLPKLQSHRGYCEDGLPENTLLSIQKAIEISYEMVEFDVRLTADGVVILFHDDYFNAQRILDIPYKELKKKIKVNTLDEVLSWLNSLTNKNIKFNIELKTDNIFSPLLEKKVVALIHKYQLIQQVLISSFNPLALMRIRFFDSKIFRALLLTFETHSKNKWYLRNRVLNLFCRPHVLNLNQADWPRFQSRNWNKNIPIVLWTYNDQLQDLDQRIHGIISDKITPDIFNR